MNGCADLWDYSGVGLSIGTLMTAQVEDGHALDGLGHKWYAEDKGDAGAKALAAKLAKFGPLEHEAIFAAVRRFWADEDRDLDSAWWREGRRRAGERLERGSAETR